MSQTHTPGPWEVAADDRNGQAVVRAEHNEVATCWHHCVGSIEKEMRANARLIAAAPELLAAATLGLKVAESWIHDQLDGTKFLADALAELDSVRAAIAKATN